MVLKLNKDVVGGLMMLVVGSLICLHGLSSYDLGTARRLGPGAMPIGVGVILAMLGAAIAAVGRGKPAQTVRVAVRPFLCVIAAIVAFAILGPRLGFVPAVVIATIITTRADADGLPFLTTFLLAAAVAFLAWLIFVQGLGLQMPAFGFRF